MLVTELIPQYINQKSFYRKAFTVVVGDMVIFKSYDAMPCYISKGVIKLNGLYSQTTTRHIREFLRQNEDLFKSNPKYAALISSNYNIKELRNIITK